jgi:hypothetical protein
MLPLLLGGCIPLPILPHDTVLRTNITGKLTPDIVAGQTTRADLLLALGEPDGAGPHDAWLAWTAGRSTGGVAGLFGGPGGGAGIIGFHGVQYRRLLARFDTAGRVTDSSYEERSCTETVGGAGNAAIASEPCVGWAWVKGTAL